MKTFLPLLCYCDYPESPDALEVVGASRRLPEGSLIPRWLRLAARFTHSVRSSAYVVSHLERIAPFSPARGGLIGSEVCMDCVLCTETVEKLGRSNLR